MFRKSVSTMLLGLALTMVSGVSGAQAPESQTAGDGPDSVKVNVTGVRSAKGRIRIELWSSEAGFPRENEHATKAVWIEAAQATSGTISATFDGLQPGTYAFAAMHDENNNGKLDTGAFGVPKEGWAVSNNVRSHTHPPKFEEAKIQVNAPNQTTDLNLHY